MKKGRVSILGVICLLAVNINIYAQYIQGIIVDKSTKKTLSGASIKFQNRGLISNSKGEFRFNIPEKLRSSTPLKVSYIGYKNIELFISSSKQYYTIEMEENSSNLSEVIVNSSAKSIVDKAFKKIESNYLQRDFTTKGFLSEYNRFDKNSYIYAIEAYLKTNTKSYKTNKTPDIEILQKKEHLYYNLDTLRFVRWGGTPRLLDYFDFVHTKKSFINPDKNQDYQYSLLDIKPFDGRDIYVIAFESKNKKEKGTLFIDYQSLAFVGAEYRHNNNKSSFDAGTSDFDVKVMYQQSNNKWFLDNISYNRISVHKLPLSNTKIKSELHLDYKCTEIDSTIIHKIGYASNIQRTDILLENKVSYDTTFWKSYDKKEGSIDLDFEKFLSKQDSINTFTPKAFLTDKQINWGHRVAKYIRKNVKFEISLGSLSSGITDDHISLNYIEPNNLFTIVQSQKVRPFNNYGLSLGWSFALPYNTSFIYQSVTDFPFSGMNQNCVSFNILKHLKTSIQQRELSVSPMLGLDFLKLSKTFDDINIPSKSKKIYDLEGEKVSPTLIKRYINLTTGLRFSFELSRRKRVFVNLKYNYELSVKNQINLKETEGFFLFRNSFTVNQILQESIIKNQTYPFTFQIGLTL